MVGADGDHSGDDPQTSGDWIVHLTSLSHCTPFNLWLLWSGGNAATGQMLYLSAPAAISSDGKIHLSGHPDLGPSSSDLTVKYFSV